MKLFGSLTSITFSPIVTIEPRRRKFHCPIRLKIPLPPGYRQELSSNLRLLCSITGGQNRAIWEDVTGSTPLSFLDGCLLFTTTVSARFWLVHCQKQQHCADSTRYAQEIYRHLIAVPFMAKFVIFAKRRDINEANIRVFCMTDDKEERTLEVQEHFTQVAKSRDVEVMEGQMMYLEFGGNLVPIYLAGGSLRPTNSMKLINEQLAFGFHAFQENRLAFAVRVKEIGQEPSGRIAFMEDSIKYLASLNSHQRAYLSERRRRAICTLGVLLPQMCVSYDDILGTPKRNSYLASARIGDLSLADIASDLEISRPLDYARSPSPLTTTTTAAAAVQSREMDQDSLTGASSTTGFNINSNRPRLDDWLELAPKLGIPRDEVEFISDYCQTSNPTGGALSPALILLLHWYKLSSQEIRDQDLARALVAIGRDDIAKKLNFPIEPKRISRSTMELLHEIEMIPVRSSENLYASKSDLGLSDAQQYRGSSLRRLDEQPQSSSSIGQRRRGSLVEGDHNHQQQQQQRQRILREQTANVQQQQQPEQAAMETRVSSRVEVPRIQVRQASLIMENPIETTVDNNSSSNNKPKQANVISSVSSSSSSSSSSSETAANDNGGDGGGRLERQFAESLIEQALGEALEVIGQRQQRENGFSGSNNHDSTTRVNQVEWAETDETGNMSFKVEHTTLIESNSSRNRKQRRKKAEECLTTHPEIDDAESVLIPSGHIIADGKSCSATESKESLVNLNGDQYLFVQPEPSSTMNTDLDQLSLQKIQRQQTWTGRGRRNTTHLTGDRSYSLSEKNSPINYLSHKVNIGKRRRSIAEIDTNCYSQLSGSRKLKQVDNSHRVSLNADHSIAATSTTTSEYITAPCIESTFAITTTTTTSSFIPDGTAAATTTTTTHYEDARSYPVDDVMKDSDDRHLDEGRTPDSEETISGGLVANFSLDLQRQPISGLACDSDATITPNMDDIILDDQSEPNSPEKRAINNPSESKLVTASVLEAAQQQQTSSIAPIRPCDVNVGDYDDNVPAQSNQEPMPSDYEKNSACEMDQQRSRLIIGHLAKGEIVANSCVELAAEAAAFSSPIEKLEKLESKIGLEQSTSSQETNMVGLSKQDDINDDIPIDCLPQFNSTHRSSLSFRRGSTISQCSSVLSEEIRQQLNFDLAPDLPPNSSLLEANALDSSESLDAVDQRPSSPEPADDGLADKPISCVATYKKSGDEYKTSVSGDQDDTRKENATAISADLSKLERSDSCHSIAKTENSAATIEDVETSAADQQQQQQQAENYHQVKIDSTQDNATTDNFGKDIETNSESISEKVNIRGQKEILQEAETLGAATKNQPANKSGRLSPSNFEQRQQSEKQRFQQQQQSVKKREQHSRASNYSTRSNSSSTISSAGSSASCQAAKADELRHRSLVELERKDQLRASRPSPPPSSAGDYRSSNGIRERTLRAESRKNNLEASSSARAHINCYCHKSR